MKNALAATLIVATAAAQAGGPMLDAVAATERRFAAAARELGWRAAFLEYFADDAIALAPDPESARDRLKTRPVRPFAEEELTWEPKAGDVAASGDIAWLTGPSTFVDHTAAQPKPSYGNYLSIWKKQKDGRWRVFIDIGTNVPAPVPFAASFTQVTASPRFRGPSDAASAASGLLAADRQLNAQLMDADAVSAYLGQIVDHARMHRTGTVPAVSVGADQIRQWFAAHPERMRAITTTGEAAASGDLGYVYGKYELAGENTQRGAYVRVWSRGGDGRWKIAADVTAPVR